MKLPNVCGLLSLLAPFLGAATYWIISLRIDVTDATTLGMGLFLIVEIMLLAFLLGFILAIVSLCLKGPFSVLAWIGLLLNGFPPLYFFVIEKCA